MKALSLKQPWATLIALGKKTIETRLWPTNYRGTILICSSKKPDQYMNAICSDLFSDYSEEDFPLGVALCTAELYDCQTMTKEHESAAMCEVYGEGRWKAKSFFLKNIRRVKPFPVKGQLGIFDVDIALNENEEFYL